MDYLLVDPAWRWPCDIGQRRRRRPRDQQPDLFMQAVCGMSLGKAEIHFLQTGGADKKQQVYLKIELEDAIVSSYSTSSGGDRPSESLSINFVKISYQYDAFSGDKITTGTPKKWDLVKNATY
jgi:type VI secretion system secreted protein Hcp